MATSEQKFRDEKLPVTAEVGDEGGSYADPTYQESEKDGIRGPGLKRNDAPLPAEPQAGPGPAEGMNKYPTE